MKMELEFIQVNLDGRSGTFDHFHPHRPGCGAGFLRQLGIVENNLTVRTVKSISERRKLQQIFTEGNGPFWAEQFINAEKQQ
jgi:hypothetical protein